MKQRGFTLIEMAIVLVVIGLILGMVFKGRQLIDQGRVKSLAAQHAKIIGAINTFYDRYGFYPGDGCTTATPASPTACTGTKRGYVTAWGSTEQNAFWHLLINVTGILTESDRRSVFGQPWQLWGDSPNAAWSNQTTWLDLPGGLQADARIICALDQMIDDGESGTGIVRASTYTKDTDCWSMSGQINAVMRILP